MVGVRVVLVHGGGKHITALLDKLQVPTRFENGYRYTKSSLAMNPDIFTWRRRKWPSPPR